MQVMHLQLLRFIFLLAIVPTILSASDAEPSQDEAPDTKKVEEPENGLITDQVSGRWYQQAAFQQQAPSAQCIPGRNECPLFAIDPSQQCCFPYRCEIQVGNSFGGISVTGRCVNGDSGGPSTGKCPHMNGIEQILTPVRDGEEFDRTVRSYEVDKQRYLHAAAYRGDAFNNYFLNVRELNLLARAQYAKTMDNIGRNVYPLIIATDVDPESGLSGLGGTYTIYLRDGSSKTMQPTSKEYEIRKSLAHIPIGLFSIVAPYFLAGGSEAVGVKGPFWDFFEKVSLTYAAAAEVKTDLSRESLVMLNITKTHMLRWSGKGFVHPPDFEKYTHELYPYIESNIRKCATLQVEAVYPALAAWKYELGNEWKNVHALIPTIWPVSAINPRLQILSKLMRPEQVRNQVFILENGGSVQSLRNTLGKIVGDRAAALMILGTRTQAQKEFTFNLSGRQDLISIASEDALNVFIANKH